MTYNPILPLTDVIKLTIIMVLWYYVKRIETIKCPRLPSWKPMYIKFYVVIATAFLLVGLLYSPLDNMPVRLIMSVLNLVLIFAVATYVREIEAEFTDCQMGKADINFQLVQEFLKLYSLIMVLLIVFTVLAIISFGISTLPIPKYESAQATITKQMTKLSMPVSTTHGLHKKPQFHKRSHKH